ncbi:MAG: hypothetical protein ACLFPE_08280 [Bacteroidales bacterium]
MRTIICIFLALLMIQCGRKTVISLWRGPDRDGVGHETNLLGGWFENGPEKLWSYKSLVLGYTSAAVTSERIFSTATSKLRPIGKKRDYLAHPVIYNEKLYLRYANSMAVYNIPANS